MVTYHFQGLQAIYIYMGTQVRDIVRFSNLQNKSETIIDKPKNNFQKHKICMTSEPSVYVVTCYFSAGKSGTLCSCVMSEFEKWTKRNCLRHSHCLDDSIKMAAFRSAVANDMVAFDLIVKAFSLNYEGNEHFIELVRPFIQQRKHKEVLTCLSFFHFALSLYRLFKRGNIKRFLLVCSSFTLPCLFTVYSTEET